MDINTVFITRYVADHDTALDWYQRLFGRPHDRSPMPNCREWELRPGLLFQVIHEPHRAGATEFAFAVDDLDGACDRLRQAGQAPSDPVPVRGFADLRFAALTDPEGVATGLLNPPA